MQKQLPHPLSYITRITLDPQYHNEVVPLCVLYLYYIYDVVSMYTSTLCIFITNYVTMWLIICHIRYVHSDIINTRSSLSDFHTRVWVLCDSSKWYLIYIYGAGLIEIMHVDHVPRLLMFQEYMFHAVVLLP